MVSDSDKPKQPKHSARTITAKGARRAREAEALRQNLLKRKQQQRGRQEHEPIRPVKSE
jgi:hypothetical protein